MESLEEYLKKASSDEKCIYDGKALASGEVKDYYDEEFPDWLKEIGNHFGEKVKTIDDLIGILIGISSTFEDYYYIIKYDDDHIEFESCVSKIEFI